MEIVHSKIILIGLTGGIASGKSEVARIFKKAQIQVINLDRLGTELIESNQDVIDDLKRICGKKIMVDGKVDRKQVRTMLFSSACKRARIEALLHPRIWGLFALRLDAFEARGKKLVICEAALLIESGIVAHFHSCIVVMADEKTRKKRLMKRDGISEKLARKMIDTQTNDTTRKRMATHLINNNGTLRTLRSKVQALMAEWKSRELL